MKYSSESLLMLKLCTYMYIQFFSVDYMQSFYPIVIFNKFIIFPKIRFKIFEKDISRFFVIIKLKSGRFKKRF